MIKKIFIYFILIFSSANLISQRADELEAVNNYVDFVNESIHGLLIVHRLLEDYNREINKYVDLPGYKINNISNKDLPLNIFEDKKHLFYERTPYEFYADISEDMDILGKNNYNQLYPIARNIFNTINAINDIRFTVADFIENNDLTKRKNLKIIYDQLEKAVELFDLFYAYQMNLEFKLSQVFPDKNNNRKIKTLLALNNAAKKVLLSVRVKNYEGFEAKINDLDNIYSIAKNKFNPGTAIYEKLLPPVKEIISEARQLQVNPKLSDGYKLYGKDYYYYNVLLIPKYNKYGNGYIRVLNDYLNIYDVKDRFEFPHYFKVIYPSKLEKEIEVIESDIKNITALPEQLRNRKVEISPKYIHRDGRESIFITIFDYKIQDGDIISINYNGKWVCQNISLETKPKRYELKLNKSGKNYLVFHSENVGQIPPNTIGINYKYKGKKEKIILASDADKSVLIEIK